MTSCFGIAFHTLQLQYAGIHQARVLLTGHQASLARARLILFKSGGASGIETGTHWP